MKKKGIKLFSLLISTMVFICNISFVKAEETSAYTYSDSATSNGVTLKVEWNEPVLGEPTTFHVSATGGSGIYKFNMEHLAIQIRMSWLMKVLQIQAGVNGQNIHQNVNLKIIHLL